MKKISTKKLMLILSLILGLSIILGIAIGPVTIDFKTVWRIVLNKSFGFGDIDDIGKNLQNIVWQLRVPRVLAGVFVGGSLALSGVAMQSFTKNPLSSPYVLGTSAGASFGAVLVIALGLFKGLRGYSIPFGAFLGSMLAIILVYSLSKSGEDLSAIKMILVGVAVSAMFSAFTNFIVYKAKDESQIRKVTFWMLGSLAGQEWKNLLALIISTVIGFILLYRDRKSMNALLVGEVSAITLGVDVDRVRKRTIFASSLMTGTAVAFSGAIGFVGLVVPHIVRSLVGANHERVIPVSLLMGSIFMIWVDVGARIIDAPGEIPIGIITSMIGAPFFLIMIKKRRYTFGGQ